MVTAAQAWLSENQNKFTQQHLVLIKNRLEQMDESKMMGVVSCDLKSPGIMLLIEILFGGLGIHRFCLGDTGMGILEFLTGGLCGILYLIDMFTVSKKTKEYNFRKIMMYL